MKKILLLSDTHSYIDNTILSFAEKMDEIWHAGDIGIQKVSNSLKKQTTLRSVYGNIDCQNIRIEYPKFLLFMCEKMKILITHIGGYPGKYPIEIKNKLEKEKPNIFICGHSHILKVMWDKEHNLLHLNPGAVGRYGHHKKRTMLSFIIEKEKIHTLNIIELS